MTNSPDYSLGARDAFTGMAHSFPDMERISRRQLYDGPQFSATTVRNFEVFGIPGEQTTKMWYAGEVALRACGVSCRDLNGLEHSIEVVAESLYHAVAQGLRVFRENDWVGNIGHGQTTISVVVKHPEVKHTRSA